MTREPIAVRHHIGGEWLDAESVGERRNPSDTEEVVSLLPAATAGLVDEAVAAASKAQRSWADASPEARADVLDRAGTLVLERASDLGRLLSREEGKTLPEGIGEATRAGRILRYFAGEAIRRHGLTLDSTRPGVSVRTHRDPVGVVGLITPWNFPIAIPAWKAAPALAFGNSVILKPSGLTPATAAALLEILLEAGLPKGVFNLVIGEADIGEAIVAHEGVDAVSFTGSQSVGAIVAGKAAGRQARVQLEMGGKNPLVVLDDCDPERAAQVALDGAFFGTGQRCTASSRLIVADKIHDDFIEALQRRMAQLRVGHALDDGTTIGPAVSEAQMTRIAGFVDRAAASGARVSDRDVPPTRTKGWYIAPTLVTETTPEMEINSKEVFGPVASVQRVTGFEEALETANHGAFGLSAGIVTDSLKYARAFERKVRAGMVMVNLPTAGVDYHVPFGGTAKSSYGSREQGFAAIEFYTQLRTVYEGA